MPLRMLVAYRDEIGRDTVSREVSAAVIPAAMCVAGKRRPQRIVFSHRGKVLPSVLNRQRFELAMGPPRN